MPDYIPRPNGKFHEWVNIVIPSVSSESNISKWSIPMSAVSPELTNAFSDFNAKYLLAENPETRTPAAITGKQESRKFLESLTRNFLKAYIIYNPAVTDEDRRNMWLPIHKTARTTTAMISSVPEAIVKMPSPAVLEIEFRGAGAKNKAKPEGMHGCEIRGVISESPVTEWGQLADSYFDTHSPLKINFTGEDRGKRFYFALRWENNRGEKGEWSEIYFAIIP